MARIHRYPSEPDLPAEQSRAIPTVTREKVAARQSVSRDATFWRKMFHRQLGFTALFLASFLGALGLLALLIAYRLGSGEARGVLIEVGVSLLLFGVTTLFLTLAVSTSLDRRLQVTITEILAEHNTEISRLTTKTQKAVEQTAEQIKPLGGNWRSLGLTNVYLTRIDALAEFGTHIKQELEDASKKRATNVGGQEPLGQDRDHPKAERLDRSGERERAPGPHAVHPSPRVPASDDEPATRASGQALPRLWIAASSMKGLLEAASVSFDGLGMFTWAADLAKHEQLDLRVLLTHPQYAKFRASQGQHQDPPPHRHLPGAFVARRRGRGAKALTTLTSRGTPTADPGGSGGRHTSNSTRRHDNQLWGAGQPLHRQAGDGPWRPAGAVAHVQSHPPL